MSKLVRVYKEEMPAAKLIGKLYCDKDRDEHGSFSQKWGEWFRDDLFSKLEASGKSVGGNAYFGAMRRVEGGYGFEYWIGMLMEPSCAVPEQFTSVDIAKSDAAVAWIKGEDDGRLYSMHEECMKAFAENGMKPSDKAWYMERYVCPRFTEPDENGEVILDYIAYLD